MYLVLLLKKHESGTFIIFILQKIYWSTHFFSGNSYCAAKKKYLLYLYLFFQLPSSRATRPVSGVSASVAS